MEIKLLIVDDDKNIIDDFIKTIQRIERDTDIKYKTYTANTLDEALEKFKYYKLDISIVDLNLKEGGLDNQDGNIVVSNIIDGFRIPIIVISGEPEKLSDIHKNNKMIKLITRGDETYSNQIIFATLIPKLLNSKTLQYFSRNGYLEHKINDFYWNNLQKTIESWDKIAIEHTDDIDKILSRHTVASLNEQLYVNGNVGHFDKFHPAEMYIIPRIIQHYHTGDILEKEGLLYTILSPACDIVNQVNLDFYILVKIVSFDELPLLEEKIKEGVDVKLDFYDKLNKKGRSCYDDCKSNKKDRFHYLPNFNIIKEGLIDFQRIKKVEKENIKEYTPIASISSIFLKDIIARFSAYYARQGQPNLM